MTGDVAVQGVDRLDYRRKPTGGTDWPPKYWKFSLELHGGGVTPEDSTSLSATTPIPSHRDRKVTAKHRKRGAAEAVEKLGSTPSAKELTNSITQAESTITNVVFVDPRRFGRIRLLHEPLAHPPVSELGFDPIHSMPTPAEFAAAVLRRRVPIKALLLDQAFAAGVGNWIADEVLYHSCIHPAQYSHTLRPDDLARLHAQIIMVCQTAVDCNGNRHQFPSDWLFHVRWGKGQRGKDHQTTRGEPIVFETVGGRTSAVVPTVQRLRPITAAKGEESKKITTNRSKKLKLAEPTTPRRATLSRKSKSDPIVVPRSVSPEISSEDDDPTPVPSSQRTPLRRNPPRRIVHAVRP
ncbi:hypothetical protein IWQ60_002515 [Tieghemiomyces parasiticus]|uniref:Formamidopyrimidine-DNA glycosylase H2TH DNA-binding domain-containing protein n=1 Tax=Tieghemiomyces parasiticus TaxID=78921 RepID=A0A9W8E0W8_9FUNG|nr:hypothetical protein IWQ60_002515 [Tieghemiomyces parasiticus]